MRNCGPSNYSLIAMVAKADVGLRPCEAWTSIILIFRYYHPEPLLNRNSIRLKAAQ
jgi:hypothetical protein